MPVSIPRKSTWLTSLDRPQIKRVQQALNSFARKNLLGQAPLIEDGKLGQHTRQAVRLYKYYLGQPRKSDTTVSRRFMRQLEHPIWLIYSTPATVARGVTRRKNQRRKWRAHQAEIAKKHGTAHYDGKVVAAYMVPHLDWARRTGHDGLKWRGVLVSGYRTPAYSESLCYAMCGAPSCPGRCAGRATNHAWTEPPRGAIDVSDYERFGYLMQYSPHHPRIFNDLPNDRVHFSPTGH